jgi:DNA-binding NtrC family response regulator
MIEIFNRNPTKPVVIVGATGVGKTEIARLIHTSSNRRDKRFHREQAAGNMAEDFGLVLAHWIGMGADSGLPNAPRGPRPGLLQDYAGGTIFLDEVHAAPENLQRFMHDVLDGEPIPVPAGKAAPLVPDVRMLFGTNVDLDQAVRDGTILHDFHRRIKTRVVELPPLADRKEDIPLFVQARCEGYKVAPEVLLCLLEYPWPDNVGELLDVLDLAKDEAGHSQARITLNHLSGLKDRLLVARVGGLGSAEADRCVFRALWDVLERQGWRRARRGRPLETQMAKLMGVSPATITRRAQQYLGRKPTSIAG